MSEGHSAPKEQLEELHQLLADHFRFLLSEARSNPEVALTLSPSMIGQMVKFLKDNDISALVKPGSAVAGLLDEMDSFPFPVKASK